MFLIIGKQIEKPWLNRKRFIGRFGNQCLIVFVMVENSKGLGSVACLFKGIRSARSSPVNVSRVSANGSKNLDKRDAVYVHAFALRLESSEKGA